MATSRVLSRYHGIDGFLGLPAIEKQLWSIAEAHVAQVPAGRMAGLHPGADGPGCDGVQPRRRPVICPLQDACVARREGRAAELPTPKPSKTLPEREVVCCAMPSSACCCRSGRTPASGRSCGCCRRPMLTAYAGLVRRARRRFAGRRRGLPVLQHTFSHYKLHLQVLSRQVHGLRVEEPTLRWVATDELPCASLPAPHPQAARWRHGQGAETNAQETPQPRVSTMSRTVFCQYEQRDEGPDFVPYPGELGQRIFSNIGKQALGRVACAPDHADQRKPPVAAHPGASRAFLEGELVKFLFEKDAESLPASPRKPDPQVVPALAGIAQMPGCRPAAGTTALFRIFPRALHLRLAQLLLGGTQCLHVQLADAVDEARRGPPVGSRTSTLSKRDDTRPMLLVNPMAAYDRSGHGPLSSSR